MDLKQLCREAESALHWRYAAAAERLCSPDLGYYESYGVLAEVKNRSEWVQADMIHDISTDLAVAGKMAELFTEHQLAFIHFKDAVEDMLP